MPRDDVKQVVGLIGYPLKHSISAAFQQPAFDYHELAVRYEAWETPPSELLAAVERVRRPDCLGMNVTIPHKEAVLLHLDSVDPWARQIGAVNTIVNRDGRLAGHNTDADAFVRALRERAGYEPGGKRVVLLGAGGAARAVALALAREGAASLAIFNRTPARAVALAEAVRRLTPDCPVEALEWGEAALGERLGAADLLVNTTSIGMARGGMASGGTAGGAADSPVAPRLLSPRLMVYDIVYNPLETPLLRDARGRGARTLSGLPMLVYQGAAAFEIWTGRPAPVGLMMARAEEALGGAGR